MPTTIDGTTGVSQVQDNSIQTADLVSNAVTPAKLSQPFTAGTAVATTSGTVIDFTGIPSWVKRITVLFNGVSTNGTSPIQVQVGNGAVVTTGYACIVGAATAGAANAFTATTGFLPLEAVVATTNLFGTLVLNLVSSNNWVCSGSCGTPATGRACSTSGGISLGGTLDRVRLTTVNGTDTFDAGSVNILYEG